MFCPNCGKEYEAGDHFCKYCSFELGAQSGYTDRADSGNAIRTESKSTGLAMILSIVLPGLGAYYIDGNQQGLIVFIMSLAIAIITNFLFVIVFVTFFVLLALWIYGLKITSDSIDDYRRQYPL